MPHSTRIVLAAFSALSIVACSASPEDLTRRATGTAEGAVIKGTASDESQDAVVLVVSLGGSRGGIGSCTGTLLAPNLVLTARHCVSDTEEGVACKSDGTPLAGGRVIRDKKASDLYIIKGVNRPTRPVADGQGAKLIINDAKNLCNNDIALLLLKEPIKDAQIAPVRLESPAMAGETITAVGWGVTDKTSSPDVRQQRAGIPVTGVGGDAREQTGPNEFRVGESICSGDSGGPGFAESTGAVLGVVSRGGNGQPPSRDPAASCVGASASNIYTGVAGFKDLLLDAYAQAGQDPWYEGEGDPRLSKDGEACSNATACRSGQCIEGKCTASCAKKPCAEGFVCSDKAGGKVCTSTSPGAGPGDGSGTITTITSCSAAPAPSSAGGSLALGLLVGAAILGARRRRD